MQPTARSSHLTKLVILALLGTISLILFFLNFPLPFLPPYLKIDFSEVPALMAALIFSPMAGVIVEGIKNVLYLVVSGAADPIGVLSNFVAGVIFIVPAAVLYHRSKGVKSVVSGLVTGTIIMAVAMSVLNYYVFLPAYAWFIGAPEMAATTAKWVAVTGGILPFNMLKGLIVGILFIPVFMKMKTWIEKKRMDLAS
ncbi:ECF transporter S component [Lentibacillus halophilus]|uniref:Riboflavin transporter n=2 Tax=Lentibacillus halophilus TaxID=295065 RepID=A0ABN0Z1X0_9BACI